MTTKTEAKKGKKRGNKAKNEKKKERKYINVEYEQKFFSSKVSFILFNKQKKWKNAFFVTVSKNNL